jgi:hypothetical protein
MATAAAAAAKEEPATRFAKDQLKAFIERVERLEEEKNARHAGLKAEAFPFQRHGRARPGHLV